MHRHIPLCEPLCKLCAHQPGHFPKLLFSEGAEDDQLIQPVQEFGPEVLLAALDHRLLSLVRSEGKVQQELGALH